jgi:hypothetical protein
MGALDPLVGALEAVTLVAAVFAGGASGASSAADKAATSAAQAASGFVYLADGSKISAQQIAAAAESFNQYAASGGAGASAAASIAQALEVQAGSARTAAEEETYLAQQTAELTASQGQMQGELRASAGSMDSLAQSAAGAGMSIAAFSNIIGTQPMGSNASGGLAIAGNTDYSYNPGHAAGGVVYSNEPYLVGERGPEMFTPSGGGTITPSGGWGGSSASYSLTIGTVIGLDDLRSQVMDWLRGARQYGSAREYLGGQ